MQTPQRPKNRNGFGKADLRRGSSQKPPPKEGRSKLKCLPTEYLQHNKSSLFVDGAEDRIMNDTPKKEYYQY